MTLGHLRRGGPINRSLTDVPADNTLHVAAGSTLNLYGGKITGNTCSNEGIIYLDYGTSTKDGDSANDSWHLGEANVPVTTKK